MAARKKKNVNSHQKNTGQNKVIKEKKVLKKPTVVKINLPSLEQKGLDNCIGKKAKNLSQQLKIELANEVALAQLCKDAEIVESVSTTPAANKSNNKKKGTSDTSKIKTTRGRKPNKTISEFFTNTTTTVAAPDAKQEQTLNKKVNEKKSVPKSPKGKTQKPQMKSAVTTAPRKRGRTVKNNTPIVMTRKRTLRSNTVINNEAEEAPIAPVAVESRNNSPISNLSWTRDISSSSATTCVTVCSTDKRVPVVQLESIDYQLDRESFTDSSTDSESPSDSNSSRPDEDDQVDAACVRDSDLSDTEPCYSSELVPDQVNLSLSSSTDRSDDETLLQINSLLNQIKVNQENLESEINKLGPCTPSEDITRDFSNILNVLILESEVLKQSRYLSSICDETVCEGPFIDRPCDSKVAESEKENVLTSSPEPDSNKSYENDNINDNNVNYTPFEDNNHEDEDALSLFAESITDIESSRINPSLASASASLPDQDEYIPLPRNPAMTRETFIYRPTKITNDKCSDDHNNTNTNDTGSHRSGVEDVSVGSPATPCRPWLRGTNEQPRFIASMHKPMQGVKSSVFKGVCFFNLISGCKNIICRYRHEVPEPAEIQRRLTIISEDNFIQEYILMRTWPELRRKYGLCYVIECDKRELTNVLVEMGIDFVTKANLNSREDAELKVTVLELVLMHLNRVRLEVCADLLRYTVHYAPFYHMLMNAIADTQNFSRFKAVFIKLSKFIIEARGSFDIDTVTKILERVCILPFEENLVRAMWSVIQNTDKKIYENNMMKKFGVLLRQLENCSGGGDSESDGDGVEENRSPLQHRPATPQHASLDTPDTDHSVTTAAPSIIRTIDLKRVKPNTVLRQFNSNNIRRHMAQWGPQRNQMFRPPAPPPNTQRQVSYGLSPMFKRGSVPKF